MKSTKLLLLAATILVSASVSAQNFGVKAGLNFSNMVSKDNNRTYSENYKMNTGFHLGPVVDYPLSELISVEAGLFYSTKGYNEVASGDFASADYKISLNYLDLPIQLKVNYNLGKGKVFLAAGPYFGYGLNGKVEGGAALGDISISSNADVKWGDEDDAILKRFDMGLSLGGGVQVNSFSLGINYALGLANISTSEVDGYKSSNRVISVSAGFYF